MRILLVAPPWVPVPPPSYGGTELVIDHLARALAQRGHEIAVFTTGDSTVPVRRSHFFANALGFTQLSPGEELAHVLASREFADSWDADVVHEHSPTGTAIPAPCPHVVTNHFLFDEVANVIYGNSHTDCSVVAISHAQASFASPNVKVSAVIHHGLDFDGYLPGDGSGGYLAFLGRMAPEKGVVSAIKVARSTGMALRIAAKMQQPTEVSYYREFVEPLLGGDVEYVGEVDVAGKQQLLREAIALVNPIQWAEPFGMVMLESMAHGTPVISAALGAAPEIIRPGVNGYLGNSIDALVAAVARIDEIDRAECRTMAQNLFSSDRMAHDYESLYESLVV